MGYLQLFIYNTYGRIGSNMESSLFISYRCLRNRVMSTFEIMARSKFLFNSMTFLSGPDLNFPV